MSTQANTRWQQVVRFVRAFPVDLLLVLVTVWVVASRTVALSTRPVAQFVFGGLLLLFLPGYGLLALIFPGSGTAPGDATQGVGPVEVRHGIGFRERIALSFGVSVALVPILALAVAATGRPYTWSTVVGSLSLFVVGTAILASLRRLALPVEQRLTLPFTEWSRDLRAFLGGGTAVDSAVSVFLVASVLLGVGASTYALAVPQQNAGYTSMTLLNRSADGTLTNANYPTNFTQGQARDLVLRVTNNRHERTEYTVVAELQRVRTGPDGSIRVLSETERKRLSVTLGPNQTWRRPHRIRPRRAGNDLRLAYYLYRGSAPADADVRSADRYLQLWINVSTNV